MEKYRVRFAPSPTGPLHIGGARSALFNYLLARQSGGQFVLRIEDTDLERSSRESEVNIFESLAWLGLEADESVQVGGDYGPYRQTERLDIYKKYADQLLAEGKAYYCFCSEEEIEAERAAAMEKGDMPMYSGKCRNLTKEQQEELLAQGRKPVIRLHVPHGEKLVVDDAVRGVVTFESDGVGDFVIVKSDGIPTYNFAVVVDDYLMKISHVIRAEEHLSNTPRQIAVYRALGWDVPKFAHISLILGEDRKKMSKRHGATSVTQYEKLGYLPEAVFNFLALLGWSPGGEEEIMTKEEIIDKFSLDAVSKSPAVFDMEKLKWLNGHYIRQSSIERLVGLAIPYLQSEGYLKEEVTEADKQWVTLIMQALQEKIHTINDIGEFMHLFIGDDITIEDEEAKEVLADQDVPTVIAAFQQKLAELPEWNADDVKKIFKAISKETGLKGKKVFMPIRVALTGQMHGPDLHFIIPVLGPELVASRLKKTVNM